MKRCGRGLPTLSTAATIVRLLYPSSTHHMHIFFPRSVTPPKPALALASPLCFNSTSALDIPSQVLHRVASSADGLRHLLPLSLFNPIS